MARHSVPRASALWMAMAVAQADQTSTSWPGAQWERADHGWSTDLLARAQAYSDRAGSSAVMIVQGGRVVAEWGDSAHKSPIASVRKSLMSALYGIAIGEGTIRLDATLAELGIDDKQPLTAEEKLATVADLLTTRSGVYHPVDSQPVGLAGALPRARQPSPRHVLVLQQLGLQRARHDLSAGYRRRHLRVVQAAHRRRRSACRISS